MHSVILATLFLVFPGSIPGLRDQGFFAGKKPTAARKASDPKAGAKPKPHQVTIQNGTQVSVYEDGVLISQTGEPAPTSSQSAPKPAGENHNKSAGGNQYNPAGANWPGYKRELPKGFNEARIRNPNDSSVKVGLRYDSAAKVGSPFGGGKDFTVPARSTQSVFVPDGAYAIFFQYSNEPEALYQGDNFTLIRKGVEIQLVQIVGGNYKIRRVK